ncbi:hypothetical protein BC828DRAFT_402057 [Blastocladiella britannica]|nr:hypothetical protein BC828DRAFT_402057 [Blastocladiella britannica]
MMKDQLGPTGVLHTGRTRDDIAASQRAFLAASKRHATAANHAEFLVLPPSTSTTRSSSPAARPPGVHGPLEVAMPVVTTLRHIGPGQVERIQQRTHASTTHYASSSSDVMVKNEGGSTTCSRVQLKRLDRATSHIRRSVAVNRDDDVLALSLASRVYHHRERELALIPDAWRGRISRLWQLLNFRTEPAGFSRLTLTAAIELLHRRLCQIESNYALWFRTLVRAGILLDPTHLRPGVTDLRTPDTQPYHPLYTQDGAESPINLPSPPRDTCVAAAVWEVRRELACAAYAQGTMDVAGAMKAGVFTDPRVVRGRFAAAAVQRIEGRVVAVQARAPLWFALNTVASAPTASTSARGAANVAVGLPGFTDPPPLVRIACEGPRWRLYVENEPQIPT